MSSGRLKSTCAGLAPSGQAIPSVDAVRRSWSTADGSGAASVRSTPTPAASMSDAAAVPVSSDISAFHASTGGRCRIRVVHPPAPSGTTSWSGSSSSMAPRATARARRSVPSSASDARAGWGRPASMSACTPA